MQPDSSRFAIGIFTVLVSLGASYATRDNFSSRSATGSVARLYEDSSTAFFSRWKTGTGLDVKVEQARSRSGKPLHVTVDGLDVPALALSSGAGGLNDKED